MFLSDTIPSSLDWAWLAAIDKESLAQAEAELEGLAEKALGANGLTNEAIDSTLKCYKVTPKEISDLALLKFIRNLFL